MSNQQGVNMFEKLNSSIIQYITHFLAPPDIGSVALTSRKTRLIFGKAVQYSFKLWQEQYSSLEKWSQQSSQKCFHSYESHLSNFKVFENESAYIRFIQLLSSKNKSLYENFFSALFEVEIHIDSENIHTQKTGLIQLNSQVLLSLQKLLTDPRVPDFKVSITNVSSTFVKHVQRIFDFVHEFIKILVEVQRLSTPNQSYQKFKAVQNYLKKNKWIQKVKYNYQYTKPIVYLNYSKNYHKFMGFNVNSIVFSFLGISDLEVLRKVDNRFSFHIKNSLPIMLNNCNLNIEKLNNLPIAPKLLEISNIYQSYKKHEIQKRDLYEIKAFANPPVAVGQTISLLIQVIEGSFDQNVRNNIRRLAINMDIQKILYFSETIELSETQLIPIEQYLSEENKRRTQMCSYFCYKIYLFLEICYLMKKNSISKGDIDHVQSIKSQILSKECYASSLEKLQTTFITTE